jgi:hypothetical protein
MNTFTLTITLLALSISSSIVANAAGSVPCEDLLKQLRETEKTASLSDAEKTNVAVLESKGIERCNADDDKRANEFFDEALKLVTKK